MVIVDCRNVFAQKYACITSYYVYLPGLWIATKQKATREELFEIIITITFPVANF